MASRTPKTVKLWISFDGGEFQVYTQEPDISYGECTQCCRPVPEDWYWEIEDGYAESLCAEACNFVPGLANLNVGQVMEFEVTRVSVKTKVKDQDTTNE